MMRLCSLTLLGATLLLAASLSQEPGPLLPLIEHVRAHPDGTAPWSIDFKALEGDRSTLPIGVFDSGIGGLTVMEAILSLDRFNNRTLQPGPDGVPDFAGERFIYLGDQANMPYGNYPARGQEHYLRELILKDAVFLLGKRFHRGTEAVDTKAPVKAIVIACNTATVFGLEDLRAALGSWKLDVPVIGVVEAGSRAVSEHLPAEGKTGTIAVLATVGTCNANAYPKAIGRATGLAGKPLPSIIQRGSVGLAGAIEGNPAFVSADPAKRPATYAGPAVANDQSPLDPTLRDAYHFDPTGLLGDPAKPETWQLNSVANYARYDVTMLAEQYRQSGGGAPIDTVVLGCTHFPIIQSELADAFSTLREFQSTSGDRPYRALIGEKIEFVSPAEFTAKELFRELAKNRLRINSENTKPPTIESSFISVPNPEVPKVKLGPDGSFTTEYKYGRTAGQLALEDFWYVPLRDAALPLDSLAGLARGLPITWKELRLRETNRRSDF